MPTVTVCFIMLVHWINSAINDALKLILLCSGDMGPNFGTMSAAQAKQFDDGYILLQNLNSCSLKVDEGQASLTQTIQAIKISRGSIETKFRGIRNRLENVEAKFSVVDAACDEIRATLVRADSVRKENIALSARLDDMEYHSWRNNLVFYGILWKLGCGRS